MNLKQLQYCAKIINVKLSDIDRMVYFPASYVWFHLLLPRLSDPHRFVRGGADQKTLASKDGLVYVLTDDIITLPKTKAQVSFPW